MEFEPLENILHTKDYIVFLNYDYMSGNYKVSLMGNKIEFSKTIEANSLKEAQEKAAEVVNNTLLRYGLEPIRQAEPLPDMRKKVEEYLEELQREITRCLNVVSEKLSAMSEASKEVFIRGTEYTVIMSRVQALSEVESDLKSRLEEVV